MAGSTSVAGIGAAPGAMATGFLRVGDLADGLSPVGIPVIVVQGASEGPCVYLHGGSHGQEPFYSVEAMRRLTHGRLAPDRLRGTVIIVPVANVLAYLAGTRVAPDYAAREQRPFAGDLHRGWPGRPDGFLTERLQHAIWTEIVARSDYVLDFHSVGLPGIGFTFLYIGGTADRQGTPAWDMTLALAQAAGLTVLVGGTGDTLTGTCLDAGKPALMLELPAARVIPEDSVEATVQATLNVLARLGMIDEKPRPLHIPVVPGVHRTMPSLRANRGGIITYAVEPGVLVSAGTVIARIYDVFGNELEAVAMPDDGYVHTFPPQAWVGAQMVATGDWVADLFA